MAYFYIQAEAECEWCAARAPGAELRISTATQELTCIPGNVESPVAVEKLPPEWDWSGGITVRCASCATKQEQAEAARKGKQKKR